MQKIVFCQFDNRLLNDVESVDPCNQYYKKLYDVKEKDGYFKSADFWELPLWIAEIKGSLKNTEYESQLLIIKDIKDAKKTLEALKPDFVLFSVLDVNKAYIKEIINNTNIKGKFILGGYIDFDYFKNMNNIDIFASVKAFIESLKIPYIYDLDYSLFKNYKTIPRLTLSKGCFFRCKFCIVENKVIEYSKRDILKQVNAFKDLDFKLIYLNDKTFGQAKNYNLLSLIYKRVKKYNPAFKGFIIQTNSSLFHKPEYVKNLAECHIFACELGLETFNNDLLKKYRKPQNIDTIKNSFKILKDLKINVIFNILIGLLGENKKSYNNTLKFLNDNLKDIYALNIYNLAIYSDSELAGDIKTLDDNDLNENITEKSFYDADDLRNNKYFYNAIFKAGDLILNN